MPRAGSTARRHADLGHSAEMALSLIVGNRCDGLSPVWIGSTSVWRDRLGRIRLVEGEHPLSNLSVAPPAPHPQWMRLPHPVRSRPARHNVLAPSLPPGTGYRYASPADLIHLQRDNSANRLTGGAFSMEYPAGADAGAYQATSRHSSRSPNTQAHRPGRRARGRWFARGRLAGGERHGVGRGSAGAGRKSERRTRSGF